MLLAFISFADCLSSRFKSETSDEMAAEMPHITRIRRNKAIPTLK
jgi:hypothetical protein